MIYDILKWQLLICDITFLAPTVTSAGMPRICVIITTESEPMKATHSVVMQSNYI